MKKDSYDDSDAFQYSVNAADVNEPILLFKEWLDLARQNEINDANAMALATVDSFGMPNVRMVLLKSFDETGLVFYTNAESQKGVELAGNMRAAGVFHWKSLRRQIRFRGSVFEVSPSEADAYFFSRERGSRIGAWASKQSRPLASRAELVKAVAVETAKFGIGSIPRPSYWTGYRIVPDSFEFWVNKTFRLHDRLVFSRQAPDALWTATRLYP